MSVALGTIFILNAIALFVFPVIGHALNMSQHEFGTWAAIAIHDTSSVVGAGAAYGEEALKVATTIKLTRALWIIPLALVTSFIFRVRTENQYSLVHLLLCAGYDFQYLCAGDYRNGCHDWGEGINSLARKTLTITLFFIDALSRDVLKAEAFSP